MAEVLSVRHTLVGSMLRQFRENHGYKLEEAARILECDRSKISRIETGHRGIRPKELRELLTEYGVSTVTQDTLIAVVRPRNASGWWEHYRRVLSSAYLDFIVAESVASRVSVYAPLQIPELLWTPEYARAVAASDPTIPEGAEDVVLEAVIGHRGATFFDRQPDCTVILGEAALRHQVGSSDVMRTQLAHVATLSGPDYPWLTIRIVPFSAGLPAAGGGGCVILQFDETPGMGLVHVSGPGGGLCLIESSDVAAYATVFAHTSVCALDPERSVLRLRQLARR